MSKRRRVLVVDDAPDLRLLARAVLGSAGFEVDEAASGPEALVELASRQSDVVVLDVQMPEIDGWDTLSAIRANPETAAARVVVCTVKEDARDALRAWELGADGYLAKPFAVDDLLSLVSDVAMRADDERARVRAAAVRAAQVAVDEEGRV